MTTDDLTTATTTTLEQKFFTEGLAELTKERQAVFREEVWRKYPAYVLKAISLFGGIFVAAQFTFVPASVVGVFIAGSVGLDQLLSNHERLMGVVAARHAFDRLRSRLKFEHSQELPAILALRDSTPSEAKVRLATLLGRLNKEMHVGKESILDGLREMDLKALKNLYVEQKK